LKKTLALRSLRRREEAPMSAVDAGIVLLARPTTLIGATTFTTEPLDVSSYGSVEFQVWRGPIAGGGGPTILFYFEESLDAQTWALGPSAPTGYDPANPVTGGDPTFDRPQFFSYGFRLRWFRIRVALTGAAPVVSCWAEGLLRDGPPLAAPPVAAAPSAVVTIGGPTIGGPFGAVPPNSRTPWGPVGYPVFYSYKKK
jgi:hypothetical protein